MLTPEMRLGKSIYSDKALLLRQGTANLPRYINKLMEMDIGSVYIDDFLGDGIDVPDAISDETRRHCKKELRNTFGKIKQNGLLERTGLGEVVNSMIDEIVSQPNIVVSLQDIGTSKDETLLHSVNTAVYGLVLGTRLGLSPISQRDLAQGLLLHDIGKILLDQEILYKSDSLTAEEFDHIKQHTALGYDILRQDLLLTEATRRVALEHHERMDGSGYNRKPGDELNALVRIAAIVDVYEALTVNRCYRKSYTASKAADILIKESAEKLDSDMVAQFFQCIAVYPNGSLVLLSNNRLAVVKEQSPGLLFRPVVRLVEHIDGQMKPGVEIDLATTLNLTIIEDDPELLSVLI
ncbi:MAG: HD-GYP domain-containing protein [Lachnospiraceae bacterium]|jgi:HD-GYP domain-containing protein (c-di-GMP phosphodiesterase class II)|nr:HD-GYP domain-containing protein [Lachnospiraceae bacterium]